MVNMLKDLIEGGFLGQAILATLVWGGIVITLIRNNPVDDRLFDAGYVILGYFFHVATAVQTTRTIARTRRAAETALLAVREAYETPRGDDVS